MNRLVLVRATGLMAAVVLCAAAPVHASFAKCLPLQVPQDKAMAARVLALADRQAPRLYRAIAANDLAALRRHLLQGDDPNACARGGSLLVLAVAHGHMEAARLLVQGGASLEQPLNDAGQTVLLQSIAQGWTGRAGKLVAMGANVRAEANGVSALHAASALETRRPPSTQAREQHDLIRLLALRGSPINSQTPEGLTPLMAALRAGRTDVIRALLSLGADPMLADGSGRSALQAARSAQRPDIEAAMASYAVAAQGAQVSYAALIEQHRHAELAAHVSRQAIDAAPHAARQALLLTAMRSRNVGAIDLLVQRGVDPNAVMTVVEGSDESPITPLLFAVAHGMGSETIEALVRVGANPNGRVALDPASTPLSMALTLQDLSAARALLRLGADPNLVTRPGDMPALANAVVLADNEHLERPLDFVRDLLDAGARIDELGPQGTTALHLAAMTNNAHALDLLLRRGADPTLRDAQGKTARDHSQRRRLHARRP